MTAISVLRTLAEFIIIITFTAIIYHLSNLKEVKPMKYYIDYGTGIGNEEITGLAKAKSRADRHAAYTQRDITIHPIVEGEIEAPVACRLWMGLRFSPEGLDDGYEYGIISLGDFGYYDQWVDL